MSFLTGEFDANQILGEHGEDVTWRTVFSYYDPETGDEIESTTEDFSITAYLEEYSIEEKLAYAGIFPKLDIRGYIEIGTPISIGDQILRYPETDNEKAFDVVNIKTYSAYLEIDLKRRED